MGPSALEGDVRENIFFTSPAVSKAKRKGLEYKYGNMQFCSMDRCRRGVSEGICKEL